MKFTHKIMMVPALAALAFGVIFVLAWGGSTEGERLTSRIRDQFYVLLEHGQELELLAVQLPYTLQSAMTAGDIEMIEEAADLRDRFHVVVEQARGVPGIHSGDMDSLGVLCDEYFSVARMATAQMIESGIDVTPEVYANLQLMFERHRALLDGVHHVVDVLRSDMQTQLDEAGARATDFRERITGTIIVGLLVMIGLSLMASISILRPVRRLRDVSEDIAQGDLRTELDYTADDDLGRLADAFRTMQTSLSDEFDRRSEAEAALRASEERLSLAFDAANDGLWDNDLRSGSFYASPRYADMLGYRSAEMPTDLDGIRRLFHPDDAEHLNSSFMAHLEHGFPFDVEARMLRKDGRWCWVQTRGKIVERNEEGRPLRVVGTNVDISVRKEAEEQLIQRTDDLERTLVELRQAQSRLIQSEKKASLGQMAAGLAHELNNPIGALRASTDVMARAEGKLDGLLAEVECLKIVRDDERVARALKALSEGRSNASEAAGRVSELVGALKSFANLDQAELQKVDIIQGLESALTVVKPELGDRIGVVRDYGDIPQITCYPGELNQVFLNLLSNAAKAIEGEGAITVATDADEREVRISVSDTGRGIPSEHIEQLFDMGFTTGDHRVKMGWGLATVDQVVKRHRGEVRVESRLGEGSTFTVALPLHWQ